MGGKAVGFTGFARQPSSRSRDGTREPHDEGRVGSETQLPRPDLPVYMNMLPRIQEQNKGQEPQQLQVISVQS